MNIQIKERNGVKIAVVDSKRLVISDVQTTLDFIMSVQHETGCNRIAINKEAVIEDFFILKTRLAGEILQKFVNYNIKVAIFGDYTTYTSKSLRDFMYESNKGKDIFFSPSANEAIESLCSV